MRQVAVLVGLCILRLTTPNADACSRLGNLPFEVDASGPSVPEPGAVELTVTYQDEYGYGSCEPNGVIFLDAAPTTGCPDFDATPFCGYRFTIVSGNPFEGLLPVPIAESYVRTMVFFVDPQASFAFDVEVRAVNRRGEEGPATMLHLEHAFDIHEDPDKEYIHLDDDDGCSAASGPNLSALFLISLDLMRRRRTEVARR